MGLNIDEIVLVTADDSPLSPEDLHAVAYQEGFDEANKSYDALIDWVWEQCVKPDDETDPSTACTTKILTILREMELHRSFR